MVGMDRIIKVIVMKKSKWTDWERIISIPIQRYAGWTGSGTRLVIGNLTIYLSGTKIVAFQERKQRIIITENLWGSGSGLHLNQIDSDKGHRIPYSEFRKKLIVALTDNGIFTELLGMDDNKKIDAYYGSW